MLEIADVSVEYPPLVAVDRVSLQVGSEILALLGPSGCGKSSLLRAIVGLEPVASGRIVFNGRDLAGVPVHERGFGLVFQEGQLFTGQSVAQNIAFGLRVAGVARAARTERVRELLDLVDLAGYGERAVWTLSGGQRQRVALARALAPRPQLLLLDEPLSALDQGLRKHLSGTLRDIIVRSGTPAILVTHDQDEAFTMADRVAVMLAGRIQREGTAMRVWREPGSRAVAQFLGYEAFEGDEAFAPLAFSVDPAGPYAGQVGAVYFRDGQATATVEVAGVGAVSVAVAAGVAAGDRLRLAVDPARVAQVNPDAECASANRRP